MLKNVLYRLLKNLVGVFFNVLNFLMAGNLPPFGSVCVIVEDQDTFLVVERPEGCYVFPGGFMLWREQAVQAVQRECEEETGLRLGGIHLIGCSSTPTGHITRMSTLTIIYQAEVVGGELRGSIEGRPCWKGKADLLYRLHHTQEGTFEHFLRYREQRENSGRFQV